jgi:hypothetical protein
VCCNVGITRGRSNEYVSMCPDMFTFRFAHVTGLGSAKRTGHCEREIVLHATPCHWAVLLGPPQPLGMQAPHSFETSATLTQRDVTQSWLHIFAQSPQTVT